MKKHLMLICCTVFIAGCSNNANVKVTKSTPAPTGVLTAPRSEPIFYNGKTYQLNYSYSDAAKAFDMKVLGLGPKQKQDAVNIATSALGYYSCPTGQRGRPTSPVLYNGTVWALQARCG